MKGDIANHSNCVTKQTTSVHNVEMCSTIMKIKTMKIKHQQEISHTDLIARTYFEFRKVI